VCWTVDLELGTRSTVGGDLSNSKEQMIVCVYCYLTRRSSYICKKRSLVHYLRLLSSLVAGSVML
jgi:hypothetical protein